VLVIAEQYSHLVGSQAAASFQKGLKAEHALGLQDTIHKCEDHIAATCKSALHLITPNMVPHICLPYVVVHNLHYHVQASGQNTMHRYCDTR